MPTEHSRSNLTERQKECLMLVKDGLTSKEIARKLRISPRTVDQHIAGAIEALGVTNRIAAIARFDETGSGAEDNSPDIQQPARIAGDRHTQSGDAVREDRLAPFLPCVGGKPNEASRAERIIWMVRIAVLSIMLTAVGVLSVMAVSYLVRTAKG